MSQTREVSSLDADRHVSGRVADTNFVKME